MKVLHCVVSLDPAQGGPPAVASRLAAAQTAHGHDVTLLAHAAPGREAEVEASLAPIPGLDRVRRVTVPPQLKLGYFVPRDSAQQVRALVRAADIVHLHGLWEPIVRHTAVQARRLGVTYVLTPHGMLDPWSLQQRRLKKRIALALGYRRVLTSAAFLHMLNQDEAKLIAPLKLGTPTRVIPNGVFLEEIDPLPPKGAFRARQPRLEHRPYILFLSRLHYKKGLDYLADAFAELATRNADLMLIVAGPDGGEREPFERRIAQHGLADRCLVVGPLYGRDKFAAFVDAACFCLPSRQEGFSMAILEALGCGVPVVISANCHFPEVAESEAGFITPLDAHAVAEALQRLLGDETLRQRMGAAGRRLVETQLTWPKIAAQALAAYQEALRGRKGS